MFEIMDRFRDEVYTVPQMFFNSARNFPERPALKFYEDDQWQVMNWAEFEQAVRLVGNGLLSLGLEKGNCVALMAHTSHRWAWADLGIQAAGGITVCIYPSLTSQETIYIGNNAQPYLFITGDAATAERIYSIKNEIKGLKAVICLEKGFEGNGEDLLNMDYVMELGRDYEAKNPDHFDKRCQELTGDDGCTVIYTSGTTGALKGVFYTQRELILGLEQSIRYCEMGGHPLTYEGVSLNVLPLSHVWERVDSYMGQLASGGCMGFARSPKTLIEDLQVIKPTWILLVPRLWSRVYTGIERTFCATEEGKKAFEWAIDVGLKSIDYYTDERGGLNLLPLHNLTWPEGLPPELREQWLKADELVYSKVRNFFGGRLVMCWSGGSRLSVDLHKKLVALSIPLLSGWGLSETSAGIAHDYPVRIKFGYVNKILPGAEAKRMEDGEIWVRGQGVAKQYFNDEEHTRENFEDGWFKSGDIGEFDEDGYLRITDRKKMIIVLDTGKNVAPARIEEVAGRGMFIDQLVVAGDDQKFISALIVPTFDAVIAAMESQGVKVDKDKCTYENMNGIVMCTAVPQELIEHPLFQKIIESEIEKINAELDDFETIKKYTIMNQRFSEEQGEITPTQKVKTGVVLKKYQDLIEKMYA